MQGAIAATLLDHAEGFSVLFSQRDTELLYPLLDLYGERVSPPTERQNHDTIILNRAPPADPTLAHKVFHHSTLCR